jgi:tRNA1Val (adenine37-N6)-methyltransferase
MTLLPGETLDTIVYPNLRIIQPLRGYRFSLDPILLGSFPDRCPAGPVMDLGCGSGVLALLLARRWPGLRVFGLEIQAAQAGRAGRSVRLNGLADRVSIIRGDLRHSRRFLRAGCAGTVVANPPYRAPGSGRLSPDPERAAARYELLMSLADLVSAIDHLLCGEGEFLLTWKPGRLGELRQRLSAGGLVLTHLRPVRSRHGGEPFLVLCRGARARAGTECEVMPQLTVYQGREYTPEAAALLTAGSAAQGSAAPLVFSPANP